MLPNNEVGFYITAKDCDGKIRVIRFYNTLEILVKSEGYRAGYYSKYGNRKFFSEAYDDRVEYHFDKYFYVRQSALYDDEQATQFAYVVIDHNEQIVPLCELNRIANNVWAPRLYRRRSWRGCAYGHYRHLKTTQERRAYYDTLDQDVLVKVRGSRRPRQLPNSWDDYISHNDRCWKTQSKRRHQWKEKV